MKPGGESFEINVSALVTDQPGRYTFSVLLDGAQEGVALGNRIVLDVPVEVTAGSLSLVSAQGRQ